MGVVVADNALYSQSCECNCWHCCLLLQQHLANADMFTMVDIQKETDLYATMISSSIYICVKIWKFTPMIPLPNDNCQILTSLSIIFQF